MRMQRDHGDPGSPRSPKMKELEGQLAMVKTKLKSTQKVNKELKDTYTELDGQFSKLESLLNLKGDRMCEKKMVLEDDENNLTFRAKDVIAQIINLRHEVDTLRVYQTEKEEIHTKNKENAQVQGLKDQLDQAQQELETLCKQKSQLQDQLCVKTNEVTQIQAQLKRLKDELQIEKDRLLQMSKDIKQETQDLHVHIKSLEETKSDETKSFLDEKERLYTRISELEEMLSERNDKLCAFQKIDKGEETEAFILREQVKSLNDKLDSLQNENKRLVIEKKKLQLDHEQCRTELENEIKKLKSKNEDQERVLKEQQNSIKKLEQPKPVNTTTIFQHRLERKIQEMANSFNMNMENNLRLLSQRILVAEQTHIETKDDYKKIKEDLELKRKELNEKTTAFEAKAREMRDTLMEVGTSMLTGLDAPVIKFGESNGDFYERLSKMANEVHLIKFWITNKIKELQHNVKILEAELDCKNNSELSLQEKVANLEKQLRLKESLFLELGEEKREVIRQLCVLIDHHRNRCDHLKEAMKQMSIRNKGTFEDNIILD